MRQPEQTEKPGAVSEMFDARCCSRCWPNLHWLALEGGTSRPERRSSPAGRRCRCVFSRHG
jgi:hypothetical protein